MKNFPFWYTLVLSLPLLLASLIFFSTQAPLNDWFYYQTLYEKILSGKIPYQDFFFEYPLGFSLLLYLAKFFRVGGGVFQIYHLSLTALATFLSFFFLQKIAKEKASSFSRKAFLTAFLFAPFFFHYYDIFPILFVILSLSFLLKSRYNLSFSLLGAGVLLKFFPLVLVVPFSFFIFRRERIPRASVLGDERRPAEGGVYGEKEETPSLPARSGRIAAGGRAGGGFILGKGAGGRRIFGAFFSFFLTLLFLSGLGIAFLGWESLSVPLLSFAQRGLHVETLLGGIFALFPQFEVVPVGAYEIGAPSWTLWSYSFASLIFLGAWGIWSFKRLKKHPREETLAKALLLGILILLLTSKIFSPQFLLWAFPFVFLLEGYLKEPKIFWGYLLILGLTDLYLLNPFYSSLLTPHHLPAAILINIRNLVLLGYLFYVWRLRLERRG